MFGCQNEKPVNESVEMYRISPKEGWKVAIFSNGSYAEIDGNSYWFSSFVNSEKYIIHEVISMMKVDSGSNKSIYHVWYESKK